MKEDQLLRRQAGLLGDQRNPFPVLPKLLLKFKEGAQLPERQSVHRVAGIYDDRHFRTLCNR